MHGQPQRKVYDYNQTSSAIKEPPWLTTNMKAAYCWWQNYLSKVKQEAWTEECKLTKQCKYSKSKLGAPCCRSGHLHWPPWCHPPLEHQLPSKHQKWPGRNSPGNSCPWTPASRRHGSFVQSNPRQTQDSSSHLPHNNLPRLGLLPEARGAWLLPGDRRGALRSRRQGTRQGFLCRFPGVGRNPLPDAYRISIPRNVKCSAVTCHLSVHTVLLSTTVMFGVSSHWGPLCADLKNTE